MTTNIATPMQADKYPFAQELITDMEGNIRKVVINFHDYLRLLEAIEDEGLILAMKTVEHEIPLNIDEALTQLEQE
jgi:RelB Antitoxin alpha helical domain